MKKQLSIAMQVEDDSDNLKKLKDQIESLIKSQFPNSKINIFYKEFGLNQLRKDGYLGYKVITNEQRKGHQTTEEKKH
jgi:hypothetical protein